MAVIALHRTLLHLTVEGKEHSVEQITKQQSANCTQVKHNHGSAQEYIELMRSLRLEPISHCLQLEGKHAGSNGN